MQSAPDKEQTVCKQKGMKLNRTSSAPSLSRVSSHTTCGLQMSFSNNNSFSATTTTNSADIFLGSCFLSFTHLENAAAEFARQNGFSYVKQSTHKLVAREAMS